MGGERETHLGVKTFPESVARGRVLVNGNLRVTRQQLRRSFNWLTAPFEIAMAQTDLAFGSLQLLDASLRRKVAQSEVPHGHKETVLTETGLWGPEASFYPLHRFLRSINYSPRSVRQPFLLNFEREDIRGRTILETAKKEADRTGKKVAIISWSKGTVSVLWMIRDHPKEVKQHVSHMIFMGSPIGCDVNGVVIKAYDLAQFFNRRVFGKDDRDLLAEMDEETEIAIPKGIKFSVIDSKRNGISVFNNGQYEGTIFVRGPHCGLAGNPEVHRVIANQLAA